MRSRGAILAAAALVAIGTPALAHGTDPELVPVIDAVTPALPAGVVVQVRTGLSEQMLVGNRTGQLLTVLDPDGTPFLRVSSTKAEGNVADPFFHETLNPPDVPARIPPTARKGAKPHWVQVAPTGEFGWFEPRVHPATPGTEAKKTGVVSRWQVEMRLGTTPFRIDGSLQRQTVTGTFFAEVEPRHDGLQVSVAQGRVPALLLIAPAERRVVVTGRDGQDFLRLDPTGAWANTASPNFRDNIDFLDRAGGRTGWVRVGDPGRVRWQDTRLQYSADRPPAVVERAGKRADLGRWSIPLTVDGASAPLEGTLTWLPVEALTSSADGGSSRWPWAVGAAFVAGFVPLLARSRASRSGRSVEKSEM